MHIKVVASGSGGNSTIIKENNLTLLIDAGASSKQLSKYLVNTTIDYLFITHEHSDHIKFLSSILKNFNVLNVCLTNGTFYHVSNILLNYTGNIIYITPDVYFIIENSINIFPLSTSHDAEEPIGLVFLINNLKLTYITDTGYVDKQYYKLISGSDLYILESNHDLNLLNDCARPKTLKDRIKGEFGHLSNKDAVGILNKVVTKDCVFIAAHISNECNTFLHIQKTFDELYKAPFKIKVYYAPQDGLEDIYL
ncbi:MAG: MBL fold metallo-hydrolase [Acholeplasmatales bacterium]|jgi:phosphoribosyl 1,2-cyclic phosphodiesterase|nr:MBL fold metallo-hydrolase [Acholeplasmatales bacterium]